MVAASAMTAAWIGFASGIIAAAVSVFIAIRQSRSDEKLEHVKSDLGAELEKVKSDLAVEQHRGEALVDRDLRAEDVLARYREPLAAAAFDLQSRLYNILRLGFLGKFGGSHPRSDTALRTTLFRLAQYFGWTEILRRDIQFLSFPEAEHTRRVAKLQSDVAKAFLRHDYGDAMMIWADEQRAIGELMIVEEHDKIMSMGYAAFSDQCNGVFKPWLDRLGVELLLPEAQVRLRDAQHLLCELVETLDANRVRYEEDLERA
jgi:hypothetical protein